MSSIARKAAGIALILVGAFVLILVPLLAPICFDIPSFSVECVGPYLPVAIPLAGLGIATIVLGLRLVRRDPSRDGPPLAEVLESSDLQGQGPLSSLVRMACESEFDNRRSG